MHIPDGYLSPASAGILYGLALPFWYAAGRKINALPSARTVPLMALLSAFCFVIQMINIPLPGGTTGHAVGAGLAAIVLTPWPAVLSVSIALVIQALFFGDGGITTIGANCLNMAVAQVFVSYYTYRTLSLKAHTPRGKSIAAGIAGYVGVNVAALLAGLELGLQPALAHAADGTPLYAPYPLSVSVPAMMLGHLVAGLAEALTAGAAVAYLLRSAPELLQFSVPAAQPQPLSPFWNRLRRLWILLGILVILTPLGLLAPGTAWGEWGSDQFQKLGLGFVPQALKKWEGFWNALFAEYSIPGLAESTGYAVSAVFGVLLILSVFWFMTLLGKRTKHP